MSECLKFQGLQPLLYMMINFQYATGVKSIPALVLNSLERKISVLYPLLIAFDKKLC